MIKKKFAVIGNPIEHSKSPVIHQLFAEQFGIDIDYIKIKVETSPAHAFSDCIAQIKENGFIGCNITLPFKEAAYQLANNRSERSQLAQAANTYLFTEKGIYADNTDGIGIVNDIVHNLSIKIHNKHVLILGAGGAVRGIISPIMDEKPLSITIANRTLSKAEKLVSLFTTHDHRIPMFAQSLNHQTNNKIHYDMVINGTSASVDGTIPDMPKGIFRHCHLAYDLMYSPNNTPFEHYAKENRVSVIRDGLGMLIEQAGASFQLWHKKTPDCMPIIKQLSSGKYD